MVGLTFGAVKNYSNQKVGQMCRRVANVSIDNRKQTEALSSRGEVRLLFLLVEKSALR